MSIDHDLGIGLIANHGPSLTEEHVTQAQRFANSLELHSTGWTEGYKQTDTLRRRTRWECIVGVSRTDKRRGPKDNPILVAKRRTKIHESGAFKACGPALPRKYAPERWVTWVVYETRPGGLLVAHINIHPHPSVQHARLGRLSARVRGHFRQMRKVERLARRLRARHGPDLLLVVSGDVNSTADWDAKYAPAQVFARLGLAVEWHGILATAHDPRLRVTSTELVPDGPAAHQNGQDHPWIATLFKEHR